MDESDFNIEKSDNLVNILLDNIKNITTGCHHHRGHHTFCGAAIGLMNIMLVTQSLSAHSEIGVRKAIGAKGKDCQTAVSDWKPVVIGQIGGASGHHVLGISGRQWNLCALIGSSFIIPLAVDHCWGGILCFFVGIISGYYPAQKASKFDPIESLRYE